MRRSCSFSTGSNLPQGLHAPFVATGAFVTFGLGQTVHASGFLAVYLAGLIVGNRATRAHNAIVAFLDAATWLAQIAMFVLFGLLAWPERLPDQLLPALGVALVLMLVARPAGVFLCLAPFRFSVREKLFISWVGLRGAVASFSPRSRCWSGLPNAQIYFDVGFIVVLVSLLVQGWTIAVAARRLRIAKRRADCSSRASSSICRASARRSWSATRWSRAAPTCAAASSHPGRSWRWSCATSA